MTNYIASLHRIFGTPDILAKLLDKLISKTEAKNIVDLCSGGGGPMLQTIPILHKKYGRHDLEMVMTDLYPHNVLAKKINTDDNSKIQYDLDSVDALNVPSKYKGIRTMICSFHHMKPDIAKKILESAADDKAPFCLLEISDNSAPQLIAAIIGLPLTFIMVLFVTPFVRPLSFVHLLFTYLIPIIPLLIAWDGTISNLRTYTLKDLDELLSDIKVDDYNWEKDLIKMKAGNMIYLMGWPQ
jgi:hypothetical protein